MSAWIFVCVLPWGTPHNHCEKYPDQPQAFLNYANVRHRDYGTYQLISPEGSHRLNVLASREFVRNGRRVVLSDHALPLEEAEYLVLLWPEALLKLKQTGQL